MVTVRVVGGDTHEIECEETYGDLLAAVGLNRHEATVLVDGQPVPADSDIDTERVQVLRLIKGG
ncbi:MAG TPA: ubiquitin-like small modifier protein 2 [Halococcus sp.]|nr:ubiquitin-like small modifier protein 2 [Halococcus sp.]